LAWPWPLVRQELYLRNFEESLLLATTPSECWAAIRGACLDLHFASAYLVLEGEIFQEVSTRSPPNPIGNSASPLVEKAA
jgi:hypothetical protein